MSAKDDETKQRLAAVGHDVLVVCRPMPGACIMMSALYAFRLREKYGEPADVVAGSLFVGSSRVFGADGDFDGECFSRTSLDWDGHAWVTLAGFLADVSVFRTAYSSGSPPALAAHVRAEFGTGKGLFICRIGDEAKSGLGYEPLYVLRREQVETLARGALAMLSQ
jgi:hypothetical protein